MSFTLRKLLAAALGTLTLGHSSALKTDEWEKRSCGQ